MRSVRYRHLLEFLTILEELTLSGEFTHPLEILTIRDSGAPVHFDSRYSE